MMSAAAPMRSLSNNDLPTRLPWATRNVFAMAPPITRVSTLVRRWPRSSSLVDTADDCGDRVLGPVEGALERVELGFHGAARISEELGGAHDRRRAGVFAMCCRKGVIDENVA